jgi:uncharacterized membrane protein
MLNLILSALRMNVYWMSWNLYLAFVPLALSLLLFRSRQSFSGAAKLSRSWFWWLQFLAFLAFLPNAPYLLTDVIHLFELSQIPNSIGIILLLVVPVYLLFMLAGFEAYVLSLINLGYYLNLMGWGRWILRAELLVHFFCAVGIYLGRFLRFNSWDFIKKPHTVVSSSILILGSFRELMIIAVTVVVLSGLYWMMKSVTLRILAKRSSGVASNRQ